MKYFVDLHVTHVSGSRMIAQGTDVLSRGAINAFGIKIIVLRKNVPLHLSEFERSCSVKE